MIPPLLTVSDLETVKAISDPLRLNILDEIGFANDRGQLRSVKQLASALESTPPRLDAHIKHLEAHGLIRVAGTQIVSGIIEKHYALSARRIEVAPDIFRGRAPAEGDRPPELAIFDSAVERTRRDLSASLKGQGGSAVQGLLMRGRE